MTVTGMTLDLILHFFRHTTTTSTPTRGKVTTTVSTATYNWCDPVLTNCNTPKNRLLILQLN